MAAKIPAIENFGHFGRVISTVGWKMVASVAHAAIPKCDIYLKNGVRSVRDIGGGKFSTMLTAKEKRSRCTEPLLFGQCRRRSESAKKTSAPLWKKPDPGRTARLGRFESQISFPAFLPSSLNMLPVSKACAAATSNLGKTVECKARQRSVNRRGSAYRIAAGAAIHFDPL